MKPRTVILTLELRDCSVPLRDLRRTREAILSGYEGCNEIPVAVAQATATVAQPSGRVVKRDHPASRRGRRKGKRR